MYKTIGMTVAIATVAAGLIGIFGPGLVQHAFAQGASSTGAATDFGSAGSSAAANFFNGGSTSSSAAGRNVQCNGQGAGPGTPFTTCAAQR